MLLPIHIAAGGLAIVLGAVALSVKKGGTIHPEAGRAPGGIPASQPLKIDHMYAVRTVIATRR
jgi:hypothetical protein